MDKSIFYLTLGKRINYFRESRGYSLAELASFVETKGVSLNKGTLSVIEKGGRPVSSYLLFCISEFLNVSIQELLSSDDFNEFSSMSAEDKKEIESF